MFTEAYFGKPYKMKSGDLALYQRSFITKIWTEIERGRYEYVDIRLHTLVSEQYVFAVHDDGVREELSMDDKFDIVSEYKFDEDKLEESAIKCWNNSDYVVAVLPLKEKDVKPVYICGYIDGYNAKYVKND